MGCDGGVTAKTTGEGRWTKVSLPALTIDDLCGTAMEVAPGTGLTIGRNADLIVGEDNPYMHRRVLHAYADGDTWYLRNVGSHVTVMVRLPGDSRGFRLAPDQAVALNGPEYSVLFGVKREIYEIAVHMDVEESADPFADFDSDGTETITVAELNDRERALVAAYAEDYLRGNVESLIVLCTDADAAVKLGTTPKALTHRRYALYELVVGGGLVSNSEWNRITPHNRMIRAVQAVIEARLVTADDLVLLEGGGAAREASMFGRFQRRRVRR